MTPRSEKDFESLMHRTLRQLPDRKAPGTLEHRVLAALAARRALPWHRQSFQHWPLPARALFIALCALVVVALFVLGTTGLEPTRALFNDQFSSLSEKLASLSSLAGTLADSFGLLGRSIPSLWIYGALGLIAATYLAFIGLGATAYRTLLAKP